MSNAVRIKTSTGWQEDLAVVGPTGDPGAVEVYEQPGMPASVTPGALWIDTDETLPTYEELPEATPHTGKWLKAQGGAAIWDQLDVADVVGLQAALDAKLDDPGYGTTLPASPVDTQEYILVDSVTTPTYSWHLRYVAGIPDTYKWVFAGGHPAEADHNVGEARAGAGDLATSGPRRSSSRGWASGASSRVPAQTARLQTLGARSTSISMG